MKANGSSAERGRRDGPPILEMQGITKRFPGVVALDGVSFDVRPGEVHALVGENGAGKSTLMKILGGVYAPDEGTLLLDGRPISFSHPWEAQQQGISIIYQEFNLLPYRTVAENIFLGREPIRRGLVDYARLRRDSAQLLARLGVDQWIEPDMLVKDLPVARQQLVEIAKALSFSSKVLVMDEPTAALTDREVELLMGLVRQLRDEGLAIVYISHRFKEVFEVADRITVLKDGRKVGTVDAADVTPDDLIRMMIGRPLDAYYPEYARPEDIGPPLLEIKGGGNDVLDDINLTVRAGEIVGVAGLQGSGRTELLRAIFGIQPFTRGTVRLRGQEVRIRSPLDAVRLRIGFLTENRKEEGLALLQPVRDNILLVHRALRPLLAKANGAPSVAELAGQVDLRAAGLDQEVQYLSGGNQQKVVLAKWLAVDADVLLFSDPTRGIDVNAKASIHRLIRSLAQSGKAILMASSELPEIIGMSDRIVVMWDGRIHGELPAGATEAEIMALATGQREGRRST
ncbi:MAG TPA: sugar ABC transporter ATP-binding protein [Limnochordales bacterium]